MTQKPQQRRGLGRGLGSLIPTAPRPEETAPRTSGAAGSATGRRAASAGRPRRRTGNGAAGSADWIGAPARRRRRPPAEARRWARRTATALRPVEGAYFAELPVTAIVPNPRQPRQVFDEEAMAELVHSVTEIGLLQPVVVRPAGEGRYELIMGERRWRATQEAGLDTIPAIVRETGDDDLLRDALLENLHRSAAEPARGGGRLPAAARRLRLHPRGAGHPDRPQPPADQQHAAAAQALPGRAAPGRRRACCRPGTPAPCSASSTPRSRTGWPAGWWPRASRCAAWRRSSRSATSGPAPRRAGPAQPPDRPGARPTWPPGSRTGWRPGSRSTSASARAGSPSSSPRCPTWSGSSG